MKRQKTVWDEKVTIRDLWMLDLISNDMKLWWQEKKINPLDIFNHKVFPDDLKNYVALTSSETENVKKCSPNEPLKMKDLKDLGLLTPVQRKRLNEAQILLDQEQRRQRQSRRTQLIAFVVGLTALGLLAYEAKRENTESIKAKEATPANKKAETKVNWQRLPLMPQRTKCL